MSVKAVLNKHETERSAELSLAGDWGGDGVFADRSALIGEFSRPSFTRVVVIGTGIERWDSRLIAFLIRILSLCEQNGVAVELKDMPDGVSPLLDLAFAVPPHVDERPVESPNDFLSALGTLALKSTDGAKTAWWFSRRTLASVVRFFHRKAVVRKVDLWTQFQDAGVNALPIVSLICFLVGVILAFVGSIQLKMFGAEIYVSSLVALAVTRVMGAIMAGVIMAGRTGASYAATIGSMQVNEEVDALKTMGVSPFDFLITPRLLALSLMMPILTVYADLMGILGGAFVGIVMLGLSPEEYARMTLNALVSKNIIVGIVHGTVFGVIIALCGCYQGLVCGRNASAVGRATTSAVVYSIVWMTVATAVLTFIFNLIGV